MYFSFIYYFYIIDLKCKLQMYTSNKIFSKFIMNLRNAKIDFLNFIAQTKSDFNVESSL